MRRPILMLTTLVLLAAATTSCSAPGRRGAVLQETWLGIPGETVADLTQHPKYREAPDQARMLGQFESEVRADAYGCRFSALLVPPATGDYTLFIASDDGGELWLSTDETEANLRPIAKVVGWSGPREWTAQKGQQSKPIRLEKGRRYLIRAFQKEGAGGDHLAVAWQGPGIERAVIAGKYLAPPPMDEPTAALVAATRRKDAEMKQLHKQVVALMEKGTTLPPDLVARLPNTCEPPPGNDTGINVLLDQAHQTYFIALWGLRGQLRGQGFRACSSIATLDSVLKPGGQSRIRLPVAGLEPFAWWPNPRFNVVITTQHDVNAQVYTAAERQALKAFVEAGGGLLLLGTRPRDKATADRWSMNALAADFGARFTEGVATHAGGSYAALDLDKSWETLARGDGGRPLRARRALGKGRVMICESIQAILPGRDDKAAAAKQKLLRKSVTWLAAGTDPVGGDGRVPATGGVGIFPERELNLGGVVVYYAGNQPPATMQCIEKDIPKAAEQLRAWLPSKVFGEPYNLVICAGGGGGWAINPRPKAAAVISYNPIGILGIFAHEMAHTMGGPRNDRDELAGISPHHNQGEAHAGWFQGKIHALFSGETGQANRGCNSILALEAKKGAQLDLATEHETAKGRTKWGKGPEWTKLWYVFQKLDDRYGPTWYPRWYWVRAMRWRDDPAHRETWDEMVEDMSIACGEDLFPFFRKIGTTLTRERLDRIDFLGETLELPVAPIDTGPAGNVCLDPIGDYTKPLKPRGK